LFLIASGLFHFIAILLNISSFFIALYIFFPRVIHHANEKTHTDHGYQSYTNSHPSATVFSSAEMNASVNKDHRPETL
jgi:ATP/ADP translocase